tara:strand:- start:1491 stop:2072 length:582 start_codon:yes stop_codon:yes gene_type:complete
MKNKNILLFGAIGVALYYLLKKDKPSTVSGTTSTTESTDTSASYKLPFTKKDLLGADRNIVLTEDVGMTKRMSAVLEYKLPYRGGARPTQFMERTSGKWIVKGNLPNLKTTKVCKDNRSGDIMPFGLPFDDPRNCVMVARTQDVVDFIFSSNLKWNAKFGKKQSSWTDGMFPPMSKPSIDGIRKGMPIPMSRS